MGSGGVMYHKGAVVSGPLDSLVNLILPERSEDYDCVSKLLNRNFKVHLFNFF